MIEAENLRGVLSANVKINRKKLSISQEKLAERTGLSAQTINDIEGRRMWVSDKTLVKLAQALEVKVFELLRPDETKIKSESVISMLENLQKGQEDIQKDMDMLKQVLEDQALRMGY